MKSAIRVCTILALAFAFFATVVQPVAMAQSSGSTSDAVVVSQASDVLTDLAARVTAGDVQEFTLSYRTPAEPDGSWVAETVEFFGPGAGLVVTTNGKEPSTP